MEKAPLCSAPWTHLYLDLDGWAYLCCLVDPETEEFSESERTLSDSFRQFGVWAEPEQKKALKELRTKATVSGDRKLLSSLDQLQHFSSRFAHSSKPLGHIKEQSLREIWESDALSEIRANFLEGRFTDRQCGNCKKSLKQGMPASKLMLSMFNRSAPYEKARLSYHLGPRSLNIHLGNFCNLKCLQCNPKYSSRHADGIVTDPHTGNNLFEAGFREFLPNLDWVNFGGGEPLLNENLYRYLDIIIESRSATAVGFITNLTAFNDRLRALLPKLWKTSFQVSLDGVGATYEKIRVGARWETVLANLEELHANQKKYRILPRIGIIMCLMHINYKDVEPLLDLCKKHDFQLYFNTVFGPDALSPYKQPAEVRARMRKELLALERSRKKDFKAFVANPELFSTF